MEAKRLQDEAAEAARKAAEEDAARRAAIEKANAEEKERLEAEAAEARRKEEARLEELRKQQQEAEQARLKREAEEAEKLKQEAEENARKSAEELEIKKQGDITMTLFEQEAHIATAEPTPETRQGFVITVTHAVGYTQLFAFWFEREGKNLGLDKLEKTSLGQIKSWCEKHAHKTEEKINSQFIKYEVSFKAVNRK